MPSTKYINHFFNKCLPYMLLRRKWRIRILIILSLIFLIIILYVNSLLKSSYLFFVIWGLRTSTSAAPSSSAMITWEIPDFAYYNNQLLLHFGTIAYMPPNTQFLSPDFRSPALRGMNGSFVPINEIFDQNKLDELHVYNRQSLGGKN